MFNTNTIDTTTQSEQPGFYLSFTPYSMTNNSSTPIIPTTTTTNAITSITATTTNKKYNNPRQKLKRNRVTSTLSKSHTSTTTSTATNNNNDNDTSDTMNVCNNNKKIKVVNNNKKNIIKTEANNAGTILNEFEEKERLRKVSHSAIERRRRERINEKINLLRQIVPNCAHDDSLHKLTVLENTIDYIQSLQNRILVLEKNTCNNTGVNVNNSNMKDNTNKNNNNVFHKKSPMITVSAPPSPVSCYPSFSSTPVQSDHEFSSNFEHSPSSSSLRNSTTVYKTTWKTPDSKSVPQSYPSPTPSLTVYQRDNLPGALLLLSEQACQQTYSQSSKEETARKNIVINHTNSSSELMSIQNLF